MSSERIDVQDDTDIEVKAVGLTVALTVDPQDHWGERSTTYLFPEEAKALRKALKRAIRTAKNPD